MIICYGHDGQCADIPRLNDLGFWPYIDKGRDLSFQDKYSRASTDDRDELKASYSFVGFITNESDETLAVFPKHYRIDDIEVDAANVFSAIRLHRQKNPSTYMGPNANQLYQSNYPFAAFYAIFDYYKRFGLYRETTKRFRPNGNGRINWKRTVSNSAKYIVRNGLVMHPLYRDDQSIRSNLVTECMAFAIDYTIHKFSFMLHEQFTGYETKNLALLEHKEALIQALEAEQQNVFQDSKRRLLSALIHFFAGLKIGGCYYLKHYGFDLIWEEAARDYLREHFLGMSPQGMKLSNAKVPITPFEKRRFYPNLAHPEQYIDPDYYYADTDAKTQYIFDAKYYTEIHGLEYKQMVYHLLLSHYRGDPASEPVFDYTHTALILPSEARGTTVHFCMDPSFSKEYEDMRIFEERLDIKSTIEYYLISI